MRNKLPASILPVALVLALLAASTRAAGSCPIVPKPVKSEDDAIIAIEKAIPAYRLTSLRLACLSFETVSQSSTSGYAIDVREKHSEQCGGDPMVAPRIFSVKVRPDGAMTSDAGRIDGVFKPLVCPQHSRRARKPSSSQ